MVASIFFCLFCFVLLFPFSFFFFFKIYILLQKDMNFSFHPESHLFFGAVIGIQEVNYQSTAFLFTFPAQKMTRINPKDANSRKCIKDSELPFPFFLSIRH